MLFDLFFSIADKIFPVAIKKFIPLIKIQPKRLKFVKSEWISSCSFFVYNRSTQVLFDVYILIEIGNAKTEDFKIEKADSYKDLKFSIKNIEINYEVVLLNIVDENNKDYIIIKISQISPSSLTPFNISANTNDDIKFKVLKYSKIENKVLQKSDAGAVSFEIPMKTKKEIKLKGISLLMKKN